MRTVLPAILISAGLILQTVPLPRRAVAWRMSTIGGAGFEAAPAGDCWKSRDCVLLSAPVSPPAGSFGNLYRIVSPEGRRSRHFRFRAAVRVEGANTKARLWLRMDRSGGGSSFQNSPDITSSGWGYYAIDAEIPADGRQIAVGFLLFGSGRAWIEDATFVEAGQSRARRVPKTGLLVI